MVEACHNMACRRQGAADDYLQLHAQTHRLMRYYIRHKFGVSTDYNTFEQHPWHGAGQGAADAALRYIALSDVLIEAYHENIQLSTIQDPTKNLEVVKSIKAFIDDVAMSAGTANNTNQDLAKVAQKQLRWWDALIKVTGGELNPSKCCGVITQWQPDKFGILRQIHPEHNAIKITLSDMAPTQQIPILPKSEGTRYLGVYIAPDGTMETMENQIWKKATLYTIALQRTHMTRREAGVIYRSCFVPAIAYPLPATWLSDQFLERIHRLSTATILNKMGFHRTLPRSMVFAPRSMGGVGLCHLGHEQMAQQIVTIIRHLRVHLQLGKTLEILIRKYQLWAGTREHVLSDTTPCPWIPDHWLLSVRKAMHNHTITIRYDNWTIPPIQEHDRFLMEDFRDYGIPSNQLEKLNACRMYLQVTTLAEITDHTGTSLLPQALVSSMHTTPKGLTNISTSLLKWPHIHQPYSSCWRLWSRTIRILYTGSPTGMQLRQPLGYWNSQHEQYRFWHWRMEDPEHLVFRSSPTAPT